MYRHRNGRAWTTESSSLTFGLVEVKCTSSKSFPLLVHDTQRWCWRCCSKDVHANVLCLTRPSELLQHRHPFISSFYAPVFLQNLRSDILQASTQWTQHSSSANLTTRIGLTSTLQQPEGFTRRKRWCHNRVNIPAAELLVF